MSGAQLKTKGIPKLEGYALPAKTYLETLRDSPVFELLNRNDERVSFSILFIPSATKTNAVIPTFFINPQYKDLSDLRPIDVRLDTDCTHVPLQTFKTTRSGQELAIFARMTIDENDDEKLDALVFTSRAGFSVLMQKDLESFLGPISTMTEIKQLSEIAFKTPETIQIIEGMLEKRRQNTFSAVLVPTGSNRFSEFLLFSPRGEAVWIADPSNVIYNIDEESMQTPMSNIRRVACSSVLPARNKVSSPYRVIDKNQPYRTLGTNEADEVVTFIVNHTDIDKRRYTREMGVYANVMALNRKLVVTWYQEVKKAYSVQLSRESSEVYFVTRNDKTLIISNEPTEESGGVVIEPEDAPDIVSEFLKTGGENVLVVDQSRKGIPVEMDRNRQGMLVDASDSVDIVRVIGAEPVPFDADPGYHSSDEYQLRQQLSNEGDYLIRNRNDLPDEQGGRHFGNPDTNRNVERPSPPQPEKIRFYEFQESPETLSFNTYGKGRLITIERFLEDLRSVRDDEYMTWFNDYRIYPSDIDAIMKAPVAYARAHPPPPVTEESGPRFNDDDDDIGFGGGLGDDDEPIIPQGAIDTLGRSRREIQEEEEEEAEAEEEEEEPVSEPVDSDQNTLFDAFASDTREFGRNVLPWECLKLMNHLLRFGILNPSNIKKAIQAQVPEKMSGKKQFQFFQDFSGLIRSLSSENMEKYENAMEYLNSLIEKLALQLKKFKEQVNPRREDWDSILKRAVELRNNVVTADYSVYRMHGLSAVFMCAESTTNFYREINLALRYADHLGIEVGKLWDLEGNLTGLPLLIYDDVPEIEIVRHKGNLYRGVYVLLKTFSSMFDLMGNFDPTEAEKLGGMFSAAFLHIYKHWSLLKGLPVSGEKIKEIQETLPLLISKDDEEYYTSEGFTMRDLTTSKIMDVMKRLLRGYLFTCDINLAGWTNPNQNPPQGPNPSSDKPNLKSKPASFANLDVTSTEFHKRMSDALIDIGAATTLFVVLNTDFVRNLCESEKKPCGLPEHEKYDSRKHGKTGFLNIPDKIPQVEKWGAAIVKPFFEKNMSALHPNFQKVIFDNDPTIRKKYPTIDARLGSHIRTLGAMFSSQDIADAGAGENPAQVPPPTIHAKKADDYKGFMIAKYELDNEDGYVKYFAIISDCIMYILIDDIFFSPIPSTLTDLSQSLMSAIKKFMRGTFMVQFPLVFGIRAEKFSSVVIATDLGFHPIFKDADHHEIVASVLLPGVTMVTDIQNRYNMVKNTALPQYVSVPTTPTHAGINSLTSGGTHNYLDRRLIYPKLKEAFNFGDSRVNQNRTILFGRTTPIIDIQKRESYVVSTDYEVDVVSTGKHFGIHAVEEDDLILRERIDLDKIAYEGVLKIYDRGGETPIASQLEAVQNNLIKWKGAQCYTIGKNAFHGLYDELTSLRKGGGVCFNRQIVTFKNFRESPWLVSMKRFFMHAGVYLNLETDPEAFSFTTFGKTNYCVFADLATIINRRAVVIGENDRFVKRREQIQSQQAFNEIPRLVANLPAKYIKSLGSEVHDFLAYGCDRFPDGFMDEIDYSDDKVESFTLHTNVTVLHSGNSMKLMDIVNDGKLEMDHIKAIKTLVKRKAPPNFLASLHNIVFVQSGTKGIVARYLVHPSFIGFTDCWKLDFWLIASEAAALITKARLNNQFDENLERFISMLAAGFGTSFKFMGMEKPPAPEIETTDWGFSEEPDIMQSKFRSYGKAERGLVSESAADQLMRFIKDPRTLSSNCDEQVEILFLNAFSILEPMIVSKLSAEYGQTCLSK